jgi:hypothetical protein
MYTLLTYHEQGTFEIIRLAVAEEVPNHDDRQDQEHDHEDLKVEIHVFAHDPADDDDQGRIEERSLDGRANAVEEREVL